jgi:dTDP-4-dehydrorhamnose 3,5-epimerase-like enzyme
LGGPSLGDSWPIANSDAILSEKDAALPLLRDLPDYFD